MQSSKRDLGMAKTNYEAALLHWHTVAIPGNFESVVYRAHAALVEAHTKYMEILAEGVVDAKR